MKPTVHFLTALFVLSSCTEYQYLTVSGENISKNEKNEFVSENDTLKVQYHFTGYKGKVGISIYNKSAQPLEIDWRRSAIIVDGKARSYYNPNAFLNATVERDSLSRRDGFSRPGDPVYLASMNGSILIDEPVQFIPPAAFIYKEPLALPVEHLENLPDSAQKASVRLAQDLTLLYKRNLYEKAGSPVRFRSYLTLRTGNGGLQKEFTVEHSFFVSEIWRATSGPQDFPESAIKRSDRFYLQP